MTYRLRRRTSTITRFREIRLRKVVYFIQMSLDMVCNLLSIWQRTLRLHK